MPWWIVLALLFAGNFKLYLKDGNFHVVREFKVQEERIRYYSIERADWEEIPAALVDLKRTETEKSAHAALVAEESKIVEDEEKAIRAEKAEIRKIPQDPGAYMVDDSGKLRIFPLAESKVHNAKGRNVLKAMSPIPLVTGKATLELDGEHSANRITMDRPEFYLQLSDEERFGIIKLTTHKGIRVAERLTIVPMTKEIVEEMDEVEIFKKQVSDSLLFKIWPVKALEPGEYAVVQYTQGKADLQLWDFAYKP